MSQLSSHPLPPYYFLLKKKRKEWTWKISLLFAETSQGLGFGLLVFLRIRVCDLISIFTNHHYHNLIFSLAMTDGFWNRQQPLHPSSTMLKRPRTEYGSLFSLFHIFDDPNTPLSRYYFLEFQSLGLYNYFDTGLHCYRIC